MPLGPILVFGTLLVLLVALSIWAQRQREKRRLALMEWARTKAFAFAADKDRGMDERFNGFHLFKQGSDRYAYNISRGNVAKGARSVYAFDYHYQTTSTGPKGERVTHDHVLSAVVISTQLKLRQLFIRSENVFDRIGEFFGFDDIDFELAEFNRAFHVSAPDRRWAFDVLHQKAMEFMLESSRFSIEFNEGRVLAYRNIEFAPHDFDDAMALISGLLDILPASVVRELTDSR